MKEKDINEDKLQRFEELVDRLEKAHDKKPHHIEDHPHHPLPPKPERLNFEFKDDIEALKEIFVDEDTVDAVVKVMEKSPSEIQIVLKVVIGLYNKIKEN